MLITLLAILLISNALTLRKDQSILFSRVVMVALIHTSFLAYNNLFFLPLDKGIGIFGGLFHVTVFTQIFNIFIFIISALILTLTSFYTRKSVSNLIKKDSLINCFYGLMLTVLIIITIKLPFLTMLSALDSRNMYFVISGCASGLLVLLKYLFFNKENNFGLVLLSIIIGASISFFLYIFSEYHVLDQIVALILPLKLNILLDFLPGREDLFKLYNNKWEISKRNLDNFFSMLNNNKLKINMSDGQSLNPNGKNINNTLFSDNNNATSGVVESQPSSSSLNRINSSEDMVEYSKLETIEFKERCIEILKEKSKKIVIGSESPYDKSVFYSELEARDQKFIKSWTRNNPDLANDRHLKTIFNEVNKANPQFSIFTSIKIKTSIGDYFFKTIGVGDIPDIMSKNEVLEWCDNNQLPHNKSLSKFLNEKDDLKKEVVKESIKKIIIENKERLPKSWFQRGHPNISGITSVDKLKDVLSELD